MSPVPTTTIAQVHAAKAWFEQHLQLPETTADPVDMSTILVPNATGEAKCLTYAEISAAADAEQQRQWNYWEGIKMKSNQYKRIRKFVLETSEEELVTLLDLTNRTMRMTHGADYFTWGQRLNAALIFKPPSGLVKISATVTLEDLRDLVYPNHHSRPEPNMRAQGFDKSFSVWNGPERRMPTFIVNNAGTGNGKTSMAVMVAFAIGTEHGFSKVCREHCERHQGIPMTGDMTKIARVVVFAVPPQVFDNFETTIHAMEHEWPRLAPGIRLCVWGKRCGPGKTHNLQKAFAASRDTLTLWVVAANQLNKALEVDPVTNPSGIIVPLIVTDEDPVKSKNKQLSTAISQMYLNATLSGLDEASRGNKSMIKTYFGGNFTSPCEIKRLLRYRNWDAADNAIRQMLLLNLVASQSMRVIVRESLAPVMPAGVDILWLPCRQSMTAYIANTSQDLLPRSLGGTLLCALQSVCLDDASLELLANMPARGTMTSDELIALLQQLRSRLTFPSDEARTAAFLPLNRIIEKIREYQGSCPICHDEGHSDDFILCSNCGTAMHSECLERWFQTSMSRRCPMCRGAMALDDNSGTSNTTSRSTLYDEDKLTQAELANIPCNDPFARMKDYLDVVIGDTMRYQAASLVRVMQAYLHAGGKRLLCITEPGGDAELFDLHALASATGFQLWNMQSLLRGSQGGQFPIVQRKFNDLTDTTPIGLVSFGQTSELIAKGTDLKGSILLIVVGSVTQDLVTQAFGRILRANSQRTGHCRTTIVRIYAGRVATRNPRIRQRPR